MSKLKSSFIDKSVSIPNPIEKDNEEKNIVNWGLDNYYPYFLNFLYQSSAIQSGIINSKVHYTTSGGLDYEGIDKEKFNQFFDNGNSDYNLDEIAEQMSKDLEISNMFCLKGLWSLDKSRCEKLEVIDFEKVRYRLDDEKIAVSNDWSDVDDNPMKLICPFDPIDRKEREFYLIYQEKSKQSIYNKNNTNKGFSRSKDSSVSQINKSIYPQPSYSGGITSILTDVKINKYQLNEISNGFSTGTIINMNNGIPTDEKEKRDIEKDIQDNATGEENAGGTIILYNNGKENEASVLNLNGNDLKDRYTALSQDNRNNIILAHSVTTPILFGIKTEGSLGNATELEIGYKIMKSNYFKYKQRAILSALNYIGEKANGLQGKIEFNDVSLDFLENKEQEVPAVFNKETFESYNDYPESAKNNAKRCLKWVEKNGWGSCGEATGKNRAHQIANGEKLSRDTISRMASFKRHQQHKDVPYSEGCGGLMWDAWGGSSGVNWAISKLKEIDKEKNSEEINVVELFEQSGRQRPETCLMTKHLPAEFDADEEREKFLNEFKKETFAELSAIENQVLAMLSDQNDFSSIRKALNINAIKLTLIFRRLKNLELIGKDSKVTTKGMREIARQDVSKIEILYSYDKNPAVSGSVLIPTSRDFCRTLVSLSGSRVWSREDINLISARIGYNAFAYRGGWYNNPQTNKNTPYCRHIWKQEIFFS